MFENRYLYFFLVIWSSAVWGQNQSTKGINYTLQTYFDGWMTGDTALLGQAMHSSCKLKVLSGDTLRVIDRNEYLGFFRPRAKPEGIKSDIQRIDVTDSIAAAKCVIKTKKHTYTDYFNLMHIGGVWFIVDKISIKNLR